MSNLGDLKVDEGEVVQAGEHITKDIVAKETSVVTVLETESDITLDDLDEELNTFRMLKKKETVV